MSGRWIIVGTVVAGGLLATHADAQTTGTGAEMYRAWCARCHADDGSGRGASALVHAQPLDFTNCRAASRESDADWRLVIARGGPVADLSADMPAFESLTPAQIDVLVAHLRSLCGDARWPTGTLSLPKALFTAKAFPENEVTFEPMVSHSRGDFARQRLTSTFAMRIGKRAAVEVAVPAESLHWLTGRVTGVGDVGVEAAYVVAAIPSRPFIATVGFEVQAPTGSWQWSFGEGAATYSPFVAMATVWRGTFVQTEIRVDWPSRQVEREENHRHLAYNVALSRDLSPDKTTWNLGVEVNGANDAVAVTPQIRKGLTRTGSLATAFGVQIPIRNLYHKAYRTFRWAAYVIWDFGESLRRRPKL